jgi:hypothetical protein
MGCASSRLMRWLRHPALDQRSQKKPRDTQRGRVQGKAS